MAREKHTPHACSATFVRGDFGEMPAHEAISRLFKNTTFIREKVETSYTIEFAKLMLLPSVLPSVVANTLRGTTRTKLRCLRAEQCCRVLQPAAVLWAHARTHARTHTHTNAHARTHARTHTHTRRSTASPKSKGADDPNAQYHNGT